MRESTGGIAKEPAEQSPIRPTHYKQVWLFISTVHKAANVKAAAEGKSGCWNNKK